MPQRIPGAGAGERADALVGNSGCSAGHMERSSAIRFDTERVARPLSERAHLSAGAGSAAPAGPADQIEHSKERLARDMVAARARWGAVEGGAERTARHVAIAAAALIAVVGAVAAAAIRSRRKRWRLWW
ncbi:hypothetical protein [Sorangium sp. So ce406]|uniref:hypothetical protein n=1 Tax=Sorangium sp. So ce406 TaxID=3133311 RepID=UPI003F5B4699